MIKYNELLQTLASSNEDITLVKHGNLRDPGWTFFAKNDKKHIAKEKMGRYAGNIIKALKSAYGIDNKGQLYSDSSREAQGEDFGIYTSKSNENH